MLPGVKRALVLSGGGSHGAFEVGAIQHLMGVEHRRYDAFAGISVGAINSAFLAQYRADDTENTASDNLTRLWNRVSNDAVRKNWWPFGPLSALWKPSVYDSRPLQNWIQSGLSEPAIKASGAQLRMVTVSWDTGESRVITEKDTDIAKWVIASSSFPAFLSPISIDGQLWTDGGLRSQTPLGEAIRADATDIDMVLCSNPFGRSSFTAEGKAALPALAMRAISLMSDEIARQDLRIAGMKNDLVGLKPEYRKVTIRVIEPSSDLPYDSLDFSPAGVQDMMAMGRRVAATTSKTST